MFTDNRQLYVLSTLFSIILTILLFAAFFAVVIIKERVIKSKFDGLEEVQLLSFESPEDTIPEPEVKPVEETVTKEYGGQTAKELFRTVHTEKATEVKPDQNLSKGKESESKIVLDRSGDSINMLRTKEHLKMETPQITTSSNKEIQTVAGDAEINDQYLSKLNKMLHTLWGNPRPTDSGKIAIVKFKISRNGSVDYRLVRSSGDQIFDDRLRSLLDQVKAKGVDKPPKSLELDLKFIVKE